jgi:hypothetical protein
MHDLGIRGATVVDGLGHRGPRGVHGIVVNGVRVFDGTEYARLDKGPGQVLDRFRPARTAAFASAAT